RRRPPCAAPPYGGGAVGDGEIRPWRGGARMSGTLHLVGIGPGDPELVTLKAARLLARVPVVAFPQTETGRTMALDIARPHLGTPARLLPIALPMLARDAE